MKDTLKDFIWFLFHKQYTPFYLLALMCIGFTYIKTRDFLLTFTILIVIAILDTIGQRIYRKHGN